MVPVPVEDGDEEGPKLEPKETPMPLRATVSRPPFLASPFILARDKTLSTDIVSDHPSSRFLLGTLTVGCAISRFYGAQPSDSEETETPVTPIARIQPLLCLSYVHIVSHGSDNELLLPRDDGMHELSTVRGRRRNEIDNHPGKGGVLLSDDGSVIKAEG